MRFPNNIYLKLCELKATIAEFDGKPNDYKIKGHEKKYYEELIKQIERGFF